MNLYEFEGKDLFQKYNIPVPNRKLVKKPGTTLSVPLPWALKAQTLSGDRMKAGGILFADTKKEAGKKLKSLFEKKIGGETVKKVLIEEKISPAAEYYISLSYDTNTRGPVLALSPKGGSGINRAKIFPLNIILDAPLFSLREALKESGFSSGDISPLSLIVKNLWNLFVAEYALLAEINPLIKIPSGQFVAADSKIILDDEKLKPNERRFISLGGDIAILASGGGASLLNIDALLLHKGRPANYTEYSGNPPAEVVKELTKRVLSQKGLKGCWVIGGTANFTDIYETMRGFLDGLAEVRPRPKYPFVIRRDGPRQKEAVVMLKTAAEKKGYEFHIFGSETPMAETAKIIVKLAYGKKTLATK